MALIYGGLDETKGAINFGSSDISVGRERGIVVDLAAGTLSPCGRGCHARLL